MENNDYSQEDWEDEQEEIEELGLDDEDDKRSICESLGIWY